MRMLAEVTAMQLIQTLIVGRDITGVSVFA